MTVSLKSLAIFAMLQFILISFYLVLKLDYNWRPPHHCRGQYQFTNGDPHNVPHDAVYAGKDKDGGILYAGRAEHEGDLIPAKVAPTHGGAFVAWGGHEHSKFQFQYLQTNHAVWKFAKNGQVPPEAISFGKTRDGEDLYMGRVVHDGALTPGKVQPSHGCLYIPYAGQELSFKEYEVLMLI